MGDRRYLRPSTSPGGLKLKPSLAPWDYLESVGFAVGPMLSTDEGGLLSELCSPPAYTYYNGNLGWTDQEKQRLMNSYPVQSRETLLRLFPDRTWGALTTKAKQLKIPRKGRHYTAEEDKLLLELRSEAVTYRKMAGRFTYRTPAALKTRYYRLKEMKTWE